MGRLEVPLPFEQEFLDTLRQTGTPDSDEACAIRETLDVHSTWALLVFSARMAIHAVRTNDPSILDVSVLLIVLIYDEVDWRDRDKVLGLIEDCAARISYDMSAGVSRVLHLGDKLSRIGLEGRTFRSTPAEGGPGGLIALEGPDGLYYDNLP